MKLGDYVLPENVEAIQVRVLALRIGEKWIYTDPYKDATFVLAQEKEHKPAPVAAPQPVVTAAPAVAAAKPRAGGPPTACPDCGKMQGSVAGLSAHRKARHPAILTAVSLDEAPPKVASHPATERIAEARHAERERVLAVVEDAKGHEVGVEPGPQVAKFEERARKAANANLDLKRSRKRDDEAP